MSPATRKSSRISKGINTKTARQFTKDCKSLESYTRLLYSRPAGRDERYRGADHRYACDIDPDTIQVSLPAPYPGTEFYEQAQANGWLVSENLAWSDGAQLCPVQYDGLSAQEIVALRDRFYKRFSSAQR